MSGGISAPFIRYPIGTSLLALGMLVIGMVCYFLLPVAALPSVEFPAIFVQAGQPGADAASHGEGRGNRTEGDEVGDQEDRKGRNRAELPLEEEVKRLRKIYPRVAWTLTATDEYPDPTDFGKVVTLAHPSKAEMAAIKLRLARDSDEVVNC